MKDFIYQDVFRKLNCNSTSVTANIQKVILYGKGACNAPKSDSDDDDTEFVKLVVQLPSLFTGNTLTVHHGNEMKEIKFDQVGAEYELFYSAFYSKCKYEMTPLESGYRLVLEYKLEWENMEKSLYSGMEETKETVKEIATALSEVKRSD